MSIGDVHVVDLDSHVYEPELIWDHYVPEKDRSAARAAFFHSTDERGMAVAILNGRQTKPIHESALVRQAIWRPGMTADDIGALDPRSGAPLNPGAWEASARLEDMDAMGVDIAVVHPTLFNEYLPLVENPDSAALLARAYNDWVHDLCQSRPDRLVPVAVLPLQNVVYARRELQRVAELGFKAVTLRPMFYAVPIEHQAGGDGSQLAGMGRMGPVLPEGMSPIFIDDDYYRSIWDELARLDLVACIHPSPGSTNLDGISAGTFIERVARPLGIGHRVAETVASIQDNAVFVTAACYHGLFEDYPTVRMALLHGSASMTPLTLEKSETYLWIRGAVSGTGPGVGLPSPVSLEPADVFEKLPIAVSFPSWERAVGRLAAHVATIGKKAAWGSRYPQHDAASPQDAIDMLRSNKLDGKLIGALMGGNAAAVFDLTTAVGASA